MIKVLIVDDHPIVREGLKLILKETPEITISGEAGTGQEALQWVLKDDFDVVLLDISMPGRSGLEVLQQLKAIRPNLKVLILSIHPEDQYALRALKSGAAGYLTKENSPAELITAILKVAAGRKYYSAALAEKLAFNLSGETTALRHDALSDREYEVMCMLASGKTVHMIANQLALSPKTISTYRRRILEKMALKSNAELMHYCIQNGLVE